MADGMRFLRIMVPLDGSEFSHFAVEHAARLAQAYAAELLLLHVVDEQVVEELAQDGNHNRAQQLREQLRENGQMYLRDATRIADECQVAHRELIGEGDPCAVICETAAARDVDLIVMGKIGRRGARRILMGSVTRRVIESTDRPVLVVGRRAGAVSARR
jgi:nucleotide-binding universal stress UspA family protein